MKPNAQRAQVPILVVDDEESMRHMLSLILTRAGYSVTSAEDGKHGFDILMERPDIRLVLCDVRMPQLDGLGLLAKITGTNLDVNVVMMSAYGTMELAIEAMRAGAVDYISKPFNADEILLVLERVQKGIQLESENQKLRGAVSSADDNTVGVVGRSKAIRELVSSLEVLAPSANRLLITGESGTGKELFARGFHKLSGRSEGPFVAINCAAIPENLLESELFGHEKGAFTGAHKRRNGLFEQAEGGTLFLDEIGDMPLALQAKLLRVLESGEVRRVGGDRSTIVDVRVVAATAKNLSLAVDSGEFRKDLMYRLDVFQLHIPPLRERLEDLPALVSFLVAKICASHGKPVPTISAAATSILESSAWPGNVRQLENAMERAVLLCRGGEVEPSDLPSGLSGAGGLTASIDDAALSIKVRIPELERELIAAALLRAGGNKSRAAKLLEISYKALLYKIRDYDLEGV
jgi:two-component system response regulator AtoC